MNILSMMIRAARPSRIADMPAVAKPFWMPKGYEGMTFFGHIITHTRQDAEAFNRTFSAIKNHEMIHLYQARDCHDSWLRFYWRYFGYWLRITLAALASRLPSRKGRRERLPRNAGYVLNPFEMEAYRHMHDLHYLDDKESGTTGWRRYAGMSLRERVLTLRRYIS
jgi:hypothetical protein